MDYTDVMQKVNGPALGHRNVNWSIFVWIGIKFGLLHYPHGLYISRMYGVLALFAW